MRIFLLLAALAVAHGARIMGPERALLSQPEFKNCGVEGATCCSLADPGPACKDTSKMFCHDEYWTPAIEGLRNTCFLKEPKGCGTFGKPCCRVENPTPPPSVTGFSDSQYRFEVWSCGPDAGSGGPYGFCDRTLNEPYGLCTACPPKGQKLDGKGFELWGWVCARDGKCGASHCG